MSARWPSTLKLDGQRRDRIHVLVRVFHQGIALTGLQDPIAHALFGLLIGRGKAVLILLKEDATAQHFHALRSIGDADNVHGMGKAVQQLRSQIAFFRVHGANKHEAGWMLEADALAFHHIHAHGRTVQEQVDHMIVEQIDFVDIKYATICRRQDARLEVTLAFLDRLFDVQRTYNAVLGGADRQIDEWGRKERGRQFALAFKALSTFVAIQVGPLRVTVEAAALHHFDFGQQGGQARAAVDFAVPRSPRINTPPICGLMAFRSRARFIRS